MFVNKPDNGGFKEEIRRKRENSPIFTPLELILLGVFLIAVAVMTLLFGYYGFEIKRDDPKPYSETYQIPQNTDNSSNSSLQEKAFGRSGD